MAQNISDSNSFTTNFDTGIPEQTDDANIVEAFNQYHYGLNYNGTGDPQGMEGHLQKITDDISDISDSLVGVVTKDIVEAQVGWLIDGSDVNKLLKTPSSLVITISNDNSTTPGHVVAPVGATVYLFNPHNGKCLIGSESGVTLRFTPGRYLRAQWSFATLIKIAANEWVLFGDIST